MTTRQEHMAWCKQRAIEYVDAGELDNALASMLSDLTKHPDTMSSVKSCGPLADLLHALETLAHIVEHPLAFGNAEELQHRLTRARAVLAKARGQS